MLTLKVENFSANTVYSYVRDKLHTKIFVAGKCVNYEELNVCVCWLQHQNIGTYTYVYIVEKKTLSSCVGYIRLVEPAHTGSDRCQITEYSGLIGCYLRKCTFIQVIFHYLECTINQRSIPVGYFLHLLVQGHQVPLLFSGVFVT